MKNDNIFHIIDQINASIPLRISNVLPESPQMRERRPYSQQKRRFQSFPLLWPRGRVMVIKQNGAEGLDEDILFLHTNLSALAPHSYKSLLNYKCLFGGVIEHNLVISCWMCLDLLLLKKMTEYYLSKPNLSWKSTVVTRK